MITCHGMFLHYSCKALLFQTEIKLSSENASKLSCPYFCAVSCHLISPRKNCLVPPLAGILMYLCFLMYIRAYLCISKCICLQCLGAANHSVLPLSMWLTYLYILTMPLLVAAARYPLLGEKSRSVGQDILSTSEGKFWYTLKAFILTCK